MILVEKVMNIKVVELIKIYNFYFGCFFIYKVVVALFIKFTYVSYSFMDFMNYKGDMQHL
jgi:hypothetical protein